MGGEYRILLRSPKKRDCFIDRGVDEKIILNWIVNMNKNCGLGWSDLE
jgi:hypothetical protein